MRAVLLAVAVLALAAGCGGGDDEPEASDNGTCESVAAPDPRDPGAREAPSAPLAEGTTYELVFTTSCGSFTVTLDQELAPNTVTSLVALARDGYFGDTVFHRVVPGFVIQGGDPTQRGDGGPGYSTVDVPPSDASYTRGTVAMAKAPLEPRGTAGSQFFVVTEDAPQLTPDYAIVGEVTEGMEAVDRIATLGVGDGPPSQAVVIESAAVTEG
ncbi:MAG TPA: peptidylprolyl isomerase [Gaiellaceae bacterium]|nr:peptidylprolyl isomerase [Gaiellaceae bacterium]